MCGIVGYVGERDCTDVLMDSLSKLEYRGYDSAGIAVFEGQQISIAKAKGKLADLSAKLEIHGKPKGHCGIGHTRWATHGEPSDANSHPHGGERVTLVHNGIIENYKELKEFLLNQSYKFLSDTDTEVVALMLDYFYKDDNPFDAIVKTINELKGSFALGIIFRDYPDTIFAVRHESPLIVGLGENESYIASDVPAILKYTRDYYLLEHDEIAVLNQDEVKVFNKLGEKQNKERQTATWDIGAAEKGGYEHFMLKEIHEQPTAINTTISPRIQNGLPNLDECGITDDKLKGYSHIYIVGCGTAMHAGLVGKYIIEKLARVSVTVDIASEFRYRNPLIETGDLVILISQSGETADTLAALRLAKNKKVDTLAIVNVKGSSIAREADMVLYTHAGPEISVASTKAYSVQLSIMYLICFQLAYANKKISEDECRRYISLLQNVPAKLEELLREKTDYQYIASQLMNTDSLLYIGRGLDYALSMEGSLKLKELSYIHSESYAAGELKHGTISLITKGLPVIAIATQDDLIEKTLSNIQEVKARGARLTIIASKNASIDMDDDYTHIIRLPEIDKLLSPLLTVVPLQLIAYYTAVIRGCDVDKPRNLAKSVTVE